ncbi:MAG TPA: hypothetical protein VK652_12370 [Steroidobacteraceae bacterium]|nr:hypothetical protein [Steroidobacteraceae bacterium]
MPWKSRLARIARIAAKTAAAFIAFVLLLGLVWAVINSFDVPLSEQAKALLMPPPNPFPADENIYLAMAGLEGAGERSITEMGQERIEAYNEALDSMLLNPDSAFGLSSQWDATKLKLSGKLELGSARSASIWASTKSHRQEIAAMLAANQQLYQRYLSLHRLRGYYETARPSYMAPVVIFPPQLRSLFLGDVANRIQTGSSKQQREALTDLQRDLQMWRTVLKGDGTLISKMLAAAFLHTDLILTADLINDTGFDSSSLDEPLDPMLLPFDPKDYRIGNTFAAEFRATAPFYQTISAANGLTGSTASSSWPHRVWNAFQAHFFKVNATENMGAELAAHWVALGDSEPSEFERNRHAYREWLEKQGPHLAPNYIYNPMGKILASLAGAQYENYPLRAYDVAAYQRLVYLAFQLKRLHIATPDVAAFLKTHPEWSTHPVDGKLFGWNPDTAELTVNTLGEETRGRRFSMTLR